MVTRSLRRDTGSGRPPTARREWPANSLQLEAQVPDRRASPSAPSYHRTVRPDSGPRWTRRAGRFILYSVFKERWPLRRASPSRSEIPSERTRIERPVAHPVAHHADVQRITPMFAAPIQHDAHDGQSCALPLIPIREVFLPLVPQADPQVVLVRRMLDRLFLPHQPSIDIFCQESPALTTADLESTQTPRTRFSADRALAAQCASGRSTHV